MRRHLYLWGVLLWPAMLALAFANALVREALYSAPLGPHLAPALSALLLAALLLGVQYAFLRRLSGRHTPRDRWALGGLWAGLTVAFDFAFYPAVLHVPYSLLLHDYDIAAGRLWALVPLSLMLGPPLLGRLLPRRPASGTQAG